jgi:hypothetical protein
MPLVIRELYIKVNVGSPSNEGTGGAATPPATGAGKENDAAAVQRAVEEMLRIESDRKER